MKTIGILITGHLPAELVDDYGDYGNLFADLLGVDRFHYQRYFVVDGQLPSDPKAADGWLITGSRHGVYEDHDWIAPLEAFIRHARDADVPTVGICFGHQIMAQALGGVVRKFDGGWAAGVTDYDRSDLDQRHKLLAWHQDQVIEPPSDGTVVSGNEFCANAALRYADWGLSFQAHPEFTPTFFARLVALRGDLLPGSMRARATVIDGELNTADVAAEIADFLGRRA